MKVIEVQEFSVQGPRDSNQDVLVRRESQDGVHFLGAFDGHGEFGEIIAQMGGAVIEQAAQFIHRSPEQAARMTSQVGMLFNRTSVWLRDRDGLADFSGSTAMAAIIYDNRADLIHLGDSVAYWIPDFGDIVRLVKPHDKHNAAEVRRVTAAGGVLKYISKGDIGRNLFWDEKQKCGLEPSRSIGDLALRFISHYVQHKTFTPKGPGQLAILTDGMCDGTVMSRELELAIRNGTLNDEFVEELAQKSGDNTSGLIARIEP